MQGTIWVGQRRGCSASALLAALSIAYHIPFKVREPAMRRLMHVWAPTNLRLTDHKLNAYDVRRIEACAIG